jgi:RNA polymerase sigma factor (sigma-70 family)
MTEPEALNGEAPSPEDALERFFARLHSDRNLAGEMYEAIRRPLITFFRHSGLGEAEDLVDETIDRVARKLDEVKDLMPFVRGVARHVASEAHRKQKHVPLDSISEPQRREDASELHDLDLERRTNCLDQCLQQLRVQDRRLILEYYQYQGAEKIRNKQRLAAELQMTLDTLGVRAFRTRKQLRGCVSQCTESGDLR